MRRIFRSRSKSISAPNRTSTTSEIIPEVDEFGRTDIKVTCPAPSVRPRQRRTSFFFNRSKTPPRPKVDLEGVDVQALKLPAMNREPFEVIQQEESSPAGRSSESTSATQSSPGTTPPVKESKLTEPRGGMPTFASMSSNTDKSLTLQAIESASSPYGTRRSSLNLQPGNGVESGQGSPEDPRLLTPTPARRGFDQDTEVDEGTGLAYSTSTPSNKGTPTSVPQASVPKIWQESRNLRSIDDEESEATPSSAHPSRQATSSATSGSISSFQTARSTPRPKSPKLPKSPLSDLIFNLERRLSSREDDSLSSNEVAIPAIVAGPNTPPASSNNYIPPFRTVRRLEDNNESLPSSSSSYTADRWSHEPTITHHQPDLTLTPLARGNVTRGDVSVSEIETNLAAVEAALQDHSIDGSFDPNNLRRKMLTTRHASVMGSEGVTLEDLNQFEMLTDSPGFRVRLPPNQEVVIANAIKQVRRALSSSQLPQIPNEDESVSNPSFDDLQTQPQLSGIESTPMRAARVRQESMQDVEEAYARMVDIVGTAAGIDLNALSPMPKVSASPARKANYYDQIPTSLSTGSGNLSYPSPSSRFSHGRTQSALPVSSSIHSHSSVASRAARQQLLRQSDILARLNQKPRETDEAVLRGRASNMSLGSRRAMSESPPRQQSINQAQLQQRAKAKRVSIEQPAGSSAHGSGAGTALGTSPSATIKTQGTPRSIEMDHHGPLSHSQQIHEWNRSRYSSSTSSVRPMHSMTQDKQIDPSSPFSATDARIMEDQKSRNRAMFGAGSKYQANTYLLSSPTNGAMRGSLNREWPRLNEDMHRGLSGASDYNNSILGSTLNSNRGFNRGNGELDRPGGLYSSTTLALQKRHALERDSLLDMLERSRNEAVVLRARKEELEADLHQEVTRVLELQREITRQREIEQVMRQSEQTMQERISTLEEELKHEHEDRNRIAELLERVQQAVDNATRVDADQDSWTSVYPSAFRDNDDYSIEGIESRIEQHSPSIRSHPSAHGLAVDDNELSWSLDNEEPLEEGRLHSTSPHTPSHGSRTPERLTDEIAPLEERIPPRPLTSKRLSHPAIASRLPVPTSSSRIASPPLQSSQMSKSISTSSTVIPTSSIASQDSITKRIIPTTPIANRGGLADRFAGSMIGKPRQSTAASSSPRSVRNLSTSSSSTGYESLRLGLSPTLHSSPTARKASTASRLTNTTGGDTSYTARSPEPVDVTTLDDDSSSFS